MSVEVEIKLKINSRKMCIRDRCEGRALTVANAALPSRTPPGHAKQEVIQLNQ